MTIRRAAHLTRLNYNGIHCFWLSMGAENYHEPLSVFTARHRSVSAPAEACLEEGILRRACTTVFRAVLCVYSILHFSSCARQISLVALLQARITKFSWLRASTNTKDYPDGFLVCRANNDVSDNFRSRNMVSQHFHFDSRAWYLFFSVGFWQYTHLGVSVEVAFKRSDDSGYVF